MRLSERVPHAFLQGLKPRDRRADVGPKGPTPKEFTPLADSRGPSEDGRYVLLGGAATCYSEGAFFVLLSFRKVPFSSSVKAWRN